ncbi:GHMP kinase [Lacinutrix sp. WUR7]|uniref:GYDIA family GHMP kinase n=1 Tax=Lacinutrix sp. WUR7 TaxID=2653681 RepID=UPI00193E534A|nr:GYDIA family GHMP kinase [Lacinutrix sp. WUR7]QRM88217.1 GHMP kinase [Lacinutrix sp. WUR7]
MKHQTFYSRGKLLLTGEYVVLDGALALAVPTKFGQSLVVEEIEAPTITWKSFDEKKQVWFEAEFHFENNEISLHTQNDNEISNRLLEILQAAQELNPQLLKDKKGFKITTLLEFPKNWGLGTSSTLIHNIASWANVDAYQLLEKTFGGSGYDIACAQNDSAITYQLHNSAISRQARNDKRTVNPISFNPSFKEHLYFVHLNKKQNSRDGIAQYKKNNFNLEIALAEIDAITKDMITCKTLDAFDILIEKHEQIISEIIHLKPVKEVLFNDFKGSIKSLGAWGGDFVLVSSKTNPTAYFKNKGFDTILAFDEMVASIY